MTWRDRVKDRTFDLKVLARGGTPYRDFLRSRDEADASSPEHVRRTALRRAVALAGTAARTSPWYRERYREAGVDPIALLEDVEAFSTLPVLEKADVREHHEALVVPGSGRRTAMASTGGSTGEPLRLVADMTVRPAAVSWRFLRWWGVHPADDVALIERTKRTPAELRRQDLLWLPTRRIRLDAASMGPEEMLRFAEQWRRVRPRLVVGYASALHEFAAFVHARGMTLPAPVAIQSEAAPITPVQQEQVAAWLSAPVYDTYRTTEINYIAAQCRVGAGLHVQSDVRVLEIVDRHGRPVPDGTEGEVVVTDLLNLAAPLIRYRVGDIARFLPDPCPCGLPFPVLSAVAGRVNDVLRLPGGRVSATSFGHLIERRPEVQQYQVHQHEDLSVTLKIVPRPGAGTAAFDDLARQIGAALGGAVPVRSALVASIPHDRGKQKRIVSDAPPSNG